MNRYLNLFMILAGIFFVFRWIFDSSNLMYFVFGAIFILFCVLILFLIKPNDNQDIGYINNPCDLLEAEAKASNNKLEALCEAVVNKELHGNDVSDEYTSLVQELNQYVMQLCIKLENLPSSSMYENVVKNIIKYKKYRMLPDDISVQFNL